MSTTLLKEIKKIRKVIHTGEDTLDRLSIEDLLKITRDWFEYYQGEEDNEKMLNLYSKLIDEEREEVKQAWLDGDLIEILDGIIDYVWVTIGFMHFGEKVARDKGEETADKEEVNRRIGRTAVMILGGSFADWDLIKLAWLEVAYSNWTKSLKKRDENDPEGKAGKIIKGSNFKKPNLKKVFKFFKNNKGQHKS